MNKRFAGFTGVILVALCADLPCQGQDAKADQLAAPLQTTLVEGECKVTPALLKDSIVVEANKVPVTTLLRAIAQQTNHKILISDEAEALGKMLVWTMYKPLDCTADAAFDYLTAGDLSWGKVGQDTYLVVPRKKSRIETESRKTEIDRLLNDLKQKQGPKKDPERDPFKAWFWFVAPAK